MNAGIIVHSHTGNTLLVAKRVEEALLTQGHNVTIARVSAVNEEPNSKKPLVLKDKPDTKPYDYIILCAPVRAFSLSPVMKAYLLQLSSLQGKKLSCFVTQHLSKPWMGGNRAVKQMAHHIGRLDGTLLHTGIINWTNKTRSEQIERMTTAFCKI